jgi:hypothetical protein
VDRSPQGLRDLLLFLPRLGVLLGKLIADPEVAVADKLLLAAVVAYILSPIDIVPDFIPGAGASCTPNGILDAAMERGTLSVTSRLGVMDERAKVAAPLQNGAL